jgi:hypothetical protein
MPRQISEENTRKEMIDPSTGSGHRPQLEQAGWYLRDHSKVKIENYISPLSLQEEFAGVVARVKSLRGRMGESARQVEGLFESLLSQSFGE